MEEMFAALDRAHEAQLAGYRRLAEEATERGGSVGAPGASLCGWKPVVSDALAVHPRQVAEARGRDARHGIQTDYLPDGRPVLRSRGHRRAMLRSLGIHDNDGGYGDG